MRLNFCTLRRRLVLINKYTDIFTVNHPQIFGTPRLIILLSLLSGHLSTFLDLWFLVKWALKDTCSLWFNHLNGGFKGELQLFVFPWRLFWVVARHNLDLILILVKICLTGVNSFNNIIWLWRLHRRLPCLWFLLLRQFLEALGVVERRHLLGLHVLCGTFQGLFQF